jgi:F0F1-type ATP synthase assembly protein I
VSNPPKNGRPSAAQSYALASRASSIALQAVLPAGLGYWLDGRWGTQPWLLVVGTVLGFSCMLLELTRLTRPPSSGGKSDSRPDDPKA